MKKVLFIFFCFCSMSHAHDNPLLELKDRSGIVSAALRAASASATASLSARLTRTQKRDAADLSSAVAEQVASYTAKADVLSQISGELASLIPLYSGFQELLTRIQGQQAVSADDVQAISDYSAQVDTGLTQIRKDVSRGFSSSPFLGEGTTLALADIVPEGTETISLGGLGKMMQGSTAVDSAVEQIQEEFLSASSNGEAIKTLLGNLGDKMKSDKKTVEDAKEKIDTQQRSFTSIAANLEESSDNQRLNSQIAAATSSKPEDIDSYTRIRIISEASRAMLGQAATQMLLQGGWRILSFPQ